jgi:hypothetical protein
MMTAILRVSLSLFLAILALAIPARAQDEGFSDSGGGGDDFSFGGSFDDFGGGGNAPRVDPLVDIRVWLERASAVQMDEKQEKNLNKLYEKEVKAMEKSFKKQFGISLQDAMAVQGSSRGRRNAYAETPYSLEIRRLSQQLVDKVIAGLRIEQQAALRKYQSEQARVVRLNNLVKSMTAAGAPLTAEQMAEVEALFARESRLRTLLIVEAKGEPHQLKVAALETQTTQRVIRLLDDAQKSALAESLSRLRAAR